MSNSLVNFGCHSLSFEFLNSISIISNSFTFGLWWQVTMKTLKMCYAELINHMFIRHLKLCGVFSIGFIFFL